MDPHLLSQEKFSWSYVVCLYQKVSQVSIVIPTSDGVQSHNDQSNYNLVVVEANVMFHFSWLLLHEP